MVLSPIAGPQRVRKTLHVFSQHALVADKRQRCAPVQFQVLYYYWQRAGRTQPKRGHVNGLLAIQKPLLDVWRETGKTFARDQCLSQWPSSTSRQFPVPTVTGGGQEREVAVGDALVYDGADQFRLVDQGEDGKEAPGVRTLRPARGPTNRAEYFLQPFFVEFSLGVGLGFQQLRRHRVPRDQIL
ncbi:hypothetical protein MCOR03_011771 [Pyricularia oryzae]|nr:hypothetical protein MCOR03_011771 [Pyricularia oryzae]KAI6548249.1 hypothetical protein MCOR09_011749 [Pyricularia oryzae]